jgi:hypothetical protein
MGPSKLKLTATIAAMVVILFAPNFTITNADKQQYQQQDPQQYQQQALLQLFLQQLLTHQPATVEKGTTTSFQSTNDSFSIQVPRGWIIVTRLWGTSAALSSRTTTRSTAYQHWQQYIQY